MIAFAVIGALLFVAFDLVGTEAAPRDDEISLSAADITALDQSFSAVWRRPPSPDERDGMIASHIRQEVLVREALALGLDQNDAVVRQRLQQKMEFLLTSAVNSLVPSDEELTAYLAENAARYEIQGRVSFDQIYLGTDATPADVDRMLADLAAGADPQHLGLRTMLPPTLEDAAAQAVDAGFGAGFYAALSEQALDVWGGPVPSGFGVHLVRITAREPARLPDLADVRDAVEAGWRTDKGKELADRQYALMRDGYKISIQDSDD